jgi:O-methyltransferase involved in polyketide biosynthesis
VIVADGLLAFLTQKDMISLLNRLTGHFPGGEVTFNGYTRFAIWAAKHYHGTQFVADLIESPGFDDPHEPERWNPGLDLVEEILLTREPEVAGFRWLFAWSPGWRHTAKPCPEEALLFCITASRRCRSRSSSYVRMSKRR